MIDYGQILASPLRASKPALSQFIAGTWCTWTYEELNARALSVAAYLASQNLKSGDRIVLLGESSLEWVALFLGTLAEGVVVVPLDVKLSDSETSEILRCARPRLIFCSPNQMKRTDLLKDFGDIVRSMEAAVGFQEQGSWKPRSAQDTTVIIYTSGTTGGPKGVLIPRRSLEFQVEELTRRMNLNFEDVFLSICPLNHLFELTCTLLCGLRSGSEICFSPSLYPEDILRAMRERRVTRMAVVPLFLKLMKSGMETQFAKLKFFAKFYLGFCKTLQGVFRFRNAFARKLLFFPIYLKFGFGFKEFVSGGAPLDLSVAKFFRNLGIMIFEGYGMTEAGPVISLNNLNHQKMGSVGLPLRGSEVKIVNDEIFVRGPHIMSGYFEDPEATREAFDEEGFLRTGDLGFVDEDGFLFVTGRSKSMIVLDGGKKIQPEEVEHLFGGEPSIKETCLSSLRGPDGRQRLVLTVVPGDAIRERIGPQTELLKSEMVGAVTGRLRDLASFKRPHELAICLRDLPKSSTRKIKRHQVEDVLRNVEGDILWITL